MRKVITQKESIKKEDWKSQNLDDNKENIFIQDDSKNEGKGKAILKDVNLYNRDWKNTKTDDQRKTISTDVGTDEEDRANHHNRQVMPGHGSLYGRYYKEGPLE